MRRVSVREARKNISALLDAAERGEEIVIERRGHPSARLVPAHRGSLASRAEFRARLEAGRTSSAKVVRDLRDEERS